MPYCRTCGKETSGSAIICRQCAESQNPIELDANGIPVGVKGWSWGAFLLNWVWAIGNRTWIGLVALIPFAGLIMAVVLGIKGREWAWKNTEWQSLDHFNRVQRRWSVWGVAVAGAIMGIGIAAAIAIPAYVQHVQRARFTAAIDTLSQGKPILVRYLDGGGSAPVEATTLAQIRSLGVTNPAIIDMDAFVADNYADIGASVTLGSQDGSIHLVSTDGGASWNCRTSFANLVESSDCEFRAKLERPQVVARLGLWERPFAQRIVDGCVASGRNESSEPEAIEYCTCAVGKVARAVPQEEVGDANAPAFREALDVALAECNLNQALSAAN